MVTNGFHLTENVCRSLKEKTGLKSVQITVDGPKAIHDTRRPLADGSGTFDVILDNIREITNHVKVNLRINLDKKNLPGLSSLFEIISQRIENKANLRVYCSPVSTKIGQPAHLKERFSLEEYGRILVDNIFPAMIKYGLDTPELPKPALLHCAAIGSSCFAIEPEGRIQKCLDLVGRAEEQIGKIQKDGSVAWNMPRILEWELWSPLADESCAQCVFLPICGGGCPFSNLRLGFRECEPWKSNIYDLMELVYKNNKDKENHG